MTKSRTFGLRRCRSPVSLANGRTGLQFQDETDPGSRVPNSSVDTPIEFPAEPCLSASDSKCPARTAHEAATNNLTLRLKRKPSTSWIRLEAILVDFQRPNLRFECRPRYAQIASGPLGTEHATAAFLQGRLNHALFLRRDSSREFDLVFRLVRILLHWQPGFAYEENLRLAKYYRSFDNVL